MGGFMSAMFGAPAQSYDMPEQSPAPLAEASKDPEAKAVRDAERRRLAARQSMGGTLLSQGRPGTMLGRKD